MMTNGAEYYFVSNLIFFAFLFFAFMAFFSYMSKKNRESDRLNKIYDLMEIDAAYKVAGKVGLKPERALFHCKALEYMEEGFSKNKFKERLEELTSEELPKKKGGKDGN